MSKGLVLEKLEDLLTIDHDKLKLAELKRVLTKVKQLVKADLKTATKADEVASEYTHEAIAIVRNQLVKVAFDPVSKNGRIVEEPVKDSRDVRGKNYMAASAALDFIKKQARAEKGYEGK